MRGEPVPDLGHRLAAALAHHRPRRLALRPGERRAAVLVPLLETGDGPALLVERRADTLPSHPGQYAFPGGVLEPGDGSLEAAALRETQEEVGIPPERVRLLGRLGDVRTPTGFLVAPVVGRAAGAIELRLQREEVAEVILVPVAAVVDRAAYRLVRRRTRDLLLRSTALVWRGHEIWGATARILLELRRVLLRAGAGQLLG